MVKNQMLNSVPQYAFAKKGMVDSTGYPASLQQLVSPLQDLSIALWPCDAIIAIPDYQPCRVVPTKTYTPHFDLLSYFEALSKPLGGNYFLCIPEFEF